jgi:hemerythrin
MTAPSGRGFYVNLKTGDPLADKTGKGRITPMQEIVWRDTYSVGVEEIDRQHQDFVKLIRRLQILQERNNQKHLVIRLIREIGKYAEFHFVSEENIMYFIRYPDLPRQESEHGKLLAAFQKQISSYETGKSTLEGLIRFLIDWFANHSTEEDKKIGWHIQQMGDVKSD